MAGDANNTALTRVTSKHGMDHSRHTAWHGPYRGLGDRVTSESVLVGICACSNRCAHPHSSKGTLGQGHIRECACGLMRVLKQMRTPTLKQAHMQVCTPSWLRHAACPWLAHTPWPSPVRSCCTPLDHTHLVQFRVVLHGVIQQISHPGRVLYLHSDLQTHAG